MAAGWSLFLVYNEAFRQTGADVRLATRGRSWYPLTKDRNDHALRRVVRRAVEKARRRAQAAPTRADADKEQVQESVQVLEVFRLQTVAVGPSPFFLRLPMVVLQLFGRLVLPAGFGFARLILKHVRNRSSIYVRRQLVNTFVVRTRKRGLQASRNINGCQHRAHR